jgi:hypothetical protein
VRAHDPERCGEPEPPAHELGREERLEEPRLRGRIHPHAVVAHLEEDVAAGRQVVVDVACGQLLATQLAGSGAEHDASAPLDRLRGVREQVEQHLADLDGIGDDTGQVPIGLDRERNAGREAGAQQARHLVGEGGDVERLGAKASASRVGEHLARELRGALGGDPDLLQLLLDGMVAGQRLAGELGIGDHRDQQVVEVVGDAAGQGRQAFELLERHHLLAELLALPLGAHARRHVRRQRVEADDLAARAQLRHVLGRERLLAVAARIGKGHLEAHALACERAFDLFADALVAGLAELLAQRTPLDLLALAAVERLVGPVHEHVAVFPVDDGDHHRKRIEQIAEVDLEARGAHDLAHRPRLARPSTRQPVRRRPPGLRRAQACRRGGDRRARHAGLRRGCRLLHASACRGCC